MDQGFYRLLLLMRQIDANIPVFPYGDCSDRLRKSADGPFRAIDKAILERIHRAPLPDPKIGAIHLFLRYLTAAWYERGKRIRRDSTAVFRLYYLLRHIRLDLVLVRVEVFLLERRHRQGKVSHINP